MYHVAHDGAIYGHVYMQAHNRQMRSPKYVWITPAWYNRGWWNATSSSCPADKLQEVVVSSLAVVPSGFFPSEDPQTVTFSGIVSSS